MQIDPECAKKRQSSQQCHLALLGPTSVKAPYKMLVKLTPGYFEIQMKQPNVITWGQIRTINTEK
jgi:hypothetical protein